MKDDFKVFFLRVLSYIFFYYIDKQIRYFYSFLFIFEVEFGQEIQEGGCVGVFGQFLILSLFYECESVRFMVVGRIGYCVLWCGKRKDFCLGMFLSFCLFLLFLVFCSFIFYYLYICLFFREFLFLVVFFWILRLEGVKRSEELEEMDGVFGEGCCYKLGMFIGFFGRGIQRVRDKRSMQFRGQRGLFMKIKYLLFLCFFRGGIKDVVVFFVVISRMVIY